MPSSRVKRARPAWEEAGGQGPFAPPVAPIQRGRRSALGWSSFPIHVLPDSLVNMHTSMLHGPKHEDTVSFDLRGETVLGPCILEFFKRHGHVALSLDAAAAGVTHIQLRWHNLHPRCYWLNLKRLCGRRCRCRWGPKRWFSPCSGFRHGTGCPRPSTSEPSLWQTFQCSHKRCRHA